MSEPTFTVRAVDGIEVKGVQATEAELLKKHEEEQKQKNADAEAQKLAAAEAEKAAAAAEEAKNTPAELREEDVLSYIEKRYKKQIKSFDELMAERNDTEALPEDVSAYLKFKKDTGRGFDDFVKLNKDYDKMNEDQAIREYLKVTQPALDDSDIDVQMDDYKYDDILDDESKVKKTKIAKKKIAAEAKEFFSKQKEKYKVPLELSAKSSISDDEKKELTTYRQYIEQAKASQEDADKKRGWFEKKTEELFNEQFKGFEFAIDDKKITFAPGDANELKKVHSSPLNFINKYLDENGLIKDAAGYHRALAMAMNPEKFAKFFYDQGKSQATGNVLNKMKNINMSDRRVPEMAPKGEFKIRAVDEGSGKSLKIRSKKH